MTEFQIHGGECDCDDCRQVSALLPLAGQDGDLWAQNSAASPVSRAVAAVMDDCRKIVFAIMEGALAPSIATTPPRGGSPAGFTDSPARQPRKPHPATQPTDGILTPEQLAERLQVPVSWVYEQTRHRGQVRNTDPLPYRKMGRYLRFNWNEVKEWLDRQNRKKRG